MARYVEWIVFSLLLSAVVTGLETLVSIRELLRIADPGSAGAIINRWLLEFGPAWTRSFPITLIAVPIVRWILSAFFRRA